MKRIISIPESIEKTLRNHLFQSELEQGAFLYSQVMQENRQLVLKIIDYYLVPSEGWQVQHELYLEMRDTERAKIMHQARQGGFAVIDCHSHPQSNETVTFSPSDVSGITDFAAYAKWKLGGKPFGAMVWGGASVDAVIWDDFLKAQPVDLITITGKNSQVLRPCGSWFVRKQKPWLWRIFNGKQTF